MESDLSGNLQCEFIYASRERMFEWFIGVWSEEVHKVALVRTSVRRSHCTCRFPACSVHEDAVFRDAREGIKSIRLTSLYSR